VGSPLSSDREGSQDAGKIGPGTGVLGSGLDDVENISGPATLAWTDYFDIHGLETPVFQKVSAQVVKVYLKVRALKSGA